MGLFEFQCPSGHIIEKLVPHAERPHTVPCSCGKEATYVVSATPTTFRSQDRKAFKRSGR